MVLLSSTLCQVGRGWPFSNGLGDVLFVLGSIPKQMKNFFASGMLFLAIGLVRLQQNFFRDRAWWPISLLFTGLLLMAAAARYAPLKMALQRLWRAL
jgi:hypothetical protein